MRSTCGWRATTVANASLFCSPARSMRSMPVGKVDGASSARPVALAPRRVRCRARQAAPSITDPRLARDQRVAGDEPDRVVLDRKLEKPVSRQITVCGERGAQRLAGVVIAGNDKDRHRQW